MPASRQAIAVAAARLPPALSPATPRRFASPPNSVTRLKMSLVGSEGVLECAGKARLRRPPIIDGDDDGAGLHREVARLPVMGSRSPATQPPPWKNTTVGADTVPSSIDPCIERAGAAFTLISHGVSTGGGGTASREAASARKASRALCGVIVVGSRSGSSGMIWAMTGSSGAGMMGPQGFAGFLVLLGR